MRASDQGALISYQTRCHQTPVKALISSWSPAVQAAACCCRRAGHSLAAFGLKALDQITGHSANCCPSNVSSFNRFLANMSVRIKSWRPTLAYDNVDISGGP